MEDLRIPDEYCHHCLETKPHQASASGNTIYCTYCKREKEIVKRGQHYGFEKTTDTFKLSLPEESNIRTKR
jgi:hypothetical protein